MYPCSKRGSQRFGSKADTYLFDEDVVRWEQFEFEVTGCRCLGFSGVGSNLVVLMISRAENRQLELSPFIYSSPSWSLAQQMAVERVSDREDGLVSLSGEQRQR